MPRCCCFVNSELPPSRSVATNCEWQGTKRLKNVACDLWTKQVPTETYDYPVFCVLFSKKVQKSISRLIELPKNNTEKQAERSQLYPFGNHFLCHVERMRDIWMHRNSSHRVRDDKTQFCYRQVLQPFIPLNRLAKWRSCFVISRELRDKTFFWGLARKNLKKHLFINN